MTPPHANIEDTNIEDVLCSKTTLKILKVLMQSEMLTVSEIAKEIGVNFASARTHLETLENISIWRRQMSKRIVLGITLTLLLVSMFGLALNIQPARATGTVYIRADGSIDPPDAPISTVDNVTYTLTGNITSPDGSGIVIERNNVTLDGSGYTIQGTKVYYARGILLAAVSNVTVKNVKITTFYTGIETYGSSRNSIRAR